VTAGTLRVPVADMKSHKDGLDKNMRKALLAEKHPAIEFVLEKYTASQPEGADSMIVKADGKLTIAGVTKPIQIEAGARHENNGLRLRGHETVLMSDYGIKPPVMMMGTVKTGKEVVVYFDLVLVPGTTAEAKP
jgi:polyisoprenoid-binding protein YceI